MGQFYQNAFSSIFALSEIVKYSIQKSTQQRFCNTSYLSDFLVVYALQIILILIFSKKNYLHIQNNNCKQILLVGCGFNEKKTIHLGCITISAQKTIHTGANRTINLTCLITHWFLSKDQGSVMHAIW